MREGDEYRILAAREGDLEFLPGIELAAATLLANSAPESVLDETTPEEKFRSALVNGRLWVALAADAPVGFAHVELLTSGAPHLAEIDVHPEHGRRGLGKRLVAAVCDWTKRSGHGEITLTTFRDVRFNMPFYQSCGFEEVPRPALRAELREIIEDEARRGLDPARRVVMRWRSGVTGETR